MGPETKVTYIRADYTQEEVDKHMSETELSGWELVTVRKNDDESFAIHWRRQHWIL